MAELAVGDLVELNSGSPGLTVVALTETNVTVVWVACDGLHEAQFPIVCVKLNEKRRVN